ncbi:MAG: sulfite exporter TauE/SafE family protein [Magnetovibrio sp.]|nr:sulfite exporter TauE/SafE family protein [Magnetovibrio sp.]
MEAAVVDWTLYWFMFPVSILVATTAMLSGIGGAAYFVPIFWIIFPILDTHFPAVSGARYALEPAQVIAVALFTEVFGFSSGFVGYHRRRLIDFGMGWAFLKYTVPVAVAGAVLLILDVFAAVWLQLIYGLMMVFVAYLLLGGHDGPGSGGRIRLPERDGAERAVTDNTGTVHTYRFHAPRWGILPLGLGGFLTGLVGVGIGEVTIPLLVRRYRVPVAVAAATSIFVVIVTVMSASFSQIIGLLNKGGINAIPWNLVVYTVPAVITGGQIGPRLQGVIPARTVERTIGVLFVIIAAAFLVLVYNQFTGGGGAAH